MLIVNDVCCSNLIQCICVKPYFTLFLSSSPPPRSENLFSRLTYGVLHMMTWKINSIISSSILTNLGVKLKQIILAPPLLKLKWALQSSLFVDLFFVAKLTDLMLRSVGPVTYKTMLPWISVAVHLVCTYLGFHFPDSSEERLLATNPIQLLFGSCHHSS